MFVQKVRFEKQQIKHMLILSLIFHHWLVNISINLLEVWIE